jgi:WD40 repeat protein
VRTFAVDADSTDFAAECAPNARSGVPSEAIYSFRAEPTIVVYAAGSYSAHALSENSAGAGRRPTCKVFNRLMGGRPLPFRTRSENLSRRPIKKAWPALLMVAIFAGAGIGQTSRPEAGEATSDLSIFDLAIDHRRREVVAVGKDGRVEVFDSVGLKRLREKSIGRGFWKCVRLSPDEKSIAIGGEAGALMLLSWPELETLRTFVGHKGDVEDIVWRRAGDIVSVSLDRTIRLWTPSDGKEVRCISVPAQAYSCTLSADQKLAFVGCDAPSLEEIDLETGRRRTLQNAKGSIYFKVRALSDGKRLVCGGGRLQVFDTEAKVSKPAFIGTRDEHGWINELAVSPDGGHFATGGDDGLIRIWSVEKPKSIVTIPTNSRPIRALAFSSDGRSIIYADSKTIARVQVSLEATEK